VNIASLTFPQFQKNITLVTGSDGTIQSDYLYPGNYSFKLYKHGHETIQFEISLKKDEAKVQNTKLLWKKVNVSITIKDTDEKIVKNIRVKSVQQPEHQQAIHGFTNEDGVAVFEDILPGKYVFEIVGEYVETENFAINTTLDSLSYSISEDVQLLCTLHGRVEDDKGNPLEDVRVSIVQQSDRNEILNFTCDGEYSIFGVYPGSYNILFNKAAYENVSVSLNLATYGLHPLRTVALIPIPANFTPYYVVGVITGSVILVSYLGYTKRLRIFDKPDYFGPEWQDIEKESGGKLEQDVKPLYFGTDKGVIIKTICVDDYHTLSDILEHSGLEESIFWDTFYELLSEGKLETTENSLYVVRNEIKKQWLASSE
jgi:protocatechuate 3,4-dioxygenase beta subunit